MNANELIDALDNANFDNAMYLCDQAATMLRQQQAEIEMLKNEVAFLRFIKEDK